MKKKIVAGVVGGKVARVGSSGHNRATWSCRNGAPREPRLPGWAGFNAITHGAKGQASLTNETKKFKVAKAG